MRNPSLKDLADELGVSKTSLSQALNDGRHVSAAKREMILDKLRERGFVPNENARRLASGKSNLVAFDYPTHAIDDSYIVRTQNALVEELREHGLHLVVSSRHDVSDVETLIQWARSQTVDGHILYWSAIMETEWSKEVGSDHPCVFVSDRPSHISGIGSVVVDLEGGFVEAGRRLKELGHRHFAFVEVGPYTGSKDARRALESQGLSLPEEFVLQSGTGYESGRAIAKSLLSLDPTPTAVLVRKDDVALGIMHGVEDLGLSLPRDLSVIGFDDSPFCRMSRLPLASLYVDPCDVARAAVDLFVRLCESPDAQFDPVIVHSRLIERESIAIAKGRSEPKENHAKKQSLHAH